MRQRLDLAIVARGLAPTRARARDLIQRGDVRIGGATVKKPAQGVGPDERIEVDPVAARVVSRGAYKLEHAISVFDFEPKGLITLDVGASTGGFTQVLLARRASQVYAVDVGRDQLHRDIANDPRVVELSRFDARRLTRREIPELPGAVVVDVSFISVTKVLGPVLDLTAPSAWLVVLVKPQFEVGRAGVGKGGIVRDDAARRAAIEAVSSFVEARPGWVVAGVVESPIAGGDGNVEYLLGARHGGLAQDG